MPDSPTAIAGILPAGAFAARLDGCPRPVRELHRAVLRAFASGETPDGRFLRHHARELGLELEPALAELQRRDVLWVDPDGARVRVAYPFSGLPTMHDVSIGHRGVRAFAMCAIDALGVAFMLGERVVVRSRDPLDRRPVEVRVEPTGAHRWLPSTAVVVAATSCSGPSATGRCPYVNFAADRHAAAGTVLAMPEAIELARSRFGSLLARA